MKLEDLHAIRMFSAIKEKQDIESEFLKFKTRLSEYLDNLNNLKFPKYTGWFVLLNYSKISESGYEFVGFFNPDLSNENDEPKWQIAIPIITEETIKEFTGW